MPVLSFAPALSLLAAFTQSPVRPLRTWWRTTGYGLRPPNPEAYVSGPHRAQDAAYAQGGVLPHQGASITVERRRGDLPTIVFGGFVPDAAEQVYLLRGFLLRHGSVYYVNYPPAGFSADLIFAQLDDLVADLAQEHHRPPLIFAVSFGAGLVLEWLKRNRRAGRPMSIRGLILVSPVTCVEDLLAPGDAKPTTLLGRAIKPYLNTGSAPDPAQVEKSRSLFTKMFESGAQNREALHGLLAPHELRRLRTAVASTLRTITPEGAFERVQALRHWESPSAYFCQTVLPLSDAPTLILYAEKEGSVLADHAPSRFAFQSAHRAYFTQSSCRIITNHRGSPVQHASLIFHCFNFLPPISAFYRRLKKRNARIGA